MPAADKKIMIRLTDEQRAAIKELTGKDAMPTASSARRKNSR